MTPRVSERAGARAAAENEPKPDAAAHVQRLDRERAARDEFWRWGRIVFALASVFLVVQLLHMVQGVVDAVLRVLLLLVFGGLVALVLLPLERLLVRRMPPTPAALLSLLAAVVAAGAVGYAISQGVIGEAQQLSHNLPQLEKPFQELQRFLSQHGIDVGIGSLASSLGIQASPGNIGSAIVSALSFTVELAVDAVIVIVAAFWLLRDRVRLRHGAVRVLPARWRVETEFAFEAFATVFGGYLRGQLLLAALVGLLALAGSALIGVPFPFLVGFAAGVFELIPLAGPFIGGGVAVLFALTRSPGVALATIGLFAVIHIVEGYVVAPRVQGRFVRLHPLVSLLALVAGVYAGGFLGAFFAVPVASLAAVLLRARLSDLREAEPELFAMTADDRELVSRRRNLLREYRGNLVARLKSAVQRLVRS
ncbi:MAG: AI-2E family transporter [Candidatus Dormibacteraeota bacterium]|nr:AI-2E family transporter [Candidatus Dormibacteraeota bacterium]